MFSSLAHHFQFDQIKVSEISERRDRLLKTENCFSHNHYTQVRLVNANGSIRVIDWNNLSGRDIFALILLMYRNCHKFLCFASILAFIRRRKRI